MNTTNQTPDPIQFLVSDAMGRYAASNFFTAFPSERMSPEPSEEDLAILQDADHVEHNETVEHCMQDLYLLSDDDLWHSIQWQEGNIIAVHPYAEWNEKDECFEMGDENARAMLEFYKEANDIDNSELEPDECLSLDSVTEQGSGPYGYGQTFEIEGEEWCLFRDDDEATDAAGEYIRDTLWAFNASFIASYCGTNGIPESAIEAIQKNDLCEDNNETFLSLVGDNLEQLIDDVICTDGLGHFLSSYDGNYEEFDFEGANLIMVRTN